jgi:hypothetical protein
MQDNQAATGFNPFKGIYVYWEKDKEFAPGAGHGFFPVDHLPRSVDKAMIFRHKFRKISQNLLVNALVKIQSDLSRIYTFHFNYNPEVNIVVPVSSQFVSVDIYFE